MRIEEMVNYFDYNYPRPESRDVPFAVDLTVMPAPWSRESKLLHLAIKGYDEAPTARPRANLVLLVDVSGSMAPRDRLDLLKRSFRLLLSQLDPADSVAIVSYAGQSGVVLEPTRVRDRNRIEAALDGLGAGGSTAGAVGIVTAYELAERNFDPKAVNRVILATDGDFNVGLSEPKRLEDLIARKRETGIYLTVLSVGAGNLNDRVAQSLAQAGNGNAAHIDNLMEARKVLIDEVDSTLFPIAEDVKIQVEFNPTRVVAYRLLGYETRALTRDDFVDDRIDAGEIGSGHTVTATYEFIPRADGTVPMPTLRYGSRTTEAPTAQSDALDEEYAYLKIRYKRPGEARSHLIEQVIGTDDDIELAEESSDDVRFAVAVTAFALLLREDRHLSNFDLSTVVRLAQASRGEDRHGYRAEFVHLVRSAETLRLAVR